MYPTYVYYPRWQRTAEWVGEVEQVFADCQSQLDTQETANTSDAALQVLAPGLKSIGFAVEGSKLAADKLFRPVFFGDNGKPERQYQIDAYHPERKVALEVEAGRSMLGNAIYRDLVQMSLLVDVEYAVIAVPMAYRYNSRNRLLASSPVPGLPLNS